MLKKITPDQLKIGFFVLSLIIAVGLRIYKLGSLPDGLNRDEASLGYTAYSLLQTGHDEHGVRWPVNIESFGDWKLPAYVYTLIPFISILGLHDWVVRLPSALAGLGTITLSYGLVTALLQQQTLKDQKKLAWLPLVACVFLTFSPWLLHFSRVAYEANLAMVFSLAGVVSLLYSLKKPLWLPISAGWWSLTLYTYHAYYVVTPLLLLLTTWLYFPEVKKLVSTHKITLVIACSIGLFAFLFLLISGSRQANTVKFSGLSIFSEEIYQEELYTTREYFPKPLQVVGKVYINTISLEFQRLFENIFQIINPTFLIISGGSHPTHNVPGLGNLHLLEFVFLVVATAAVWRERQRWQLFLIGWTLIGFLPAIITIEPNHSVRTSAALVPLAILSSYGFLRLYQPQTLIMRNGLILVLFFSYFYLLTTYFIVYPFSGRDRWAWYMPQLTKNIRELKDSYDLVYMDGEHASPYIYFLYYGSVDPRKLATDLEYYPRDEEGFRHVKRWQNVYFQKVDWKDIESQEKKVLIAVPPSQIPGDKLVKRQYKVLTVISDPHDDRQLVILDYDKFR